jgi:hypothetical protein
LQQLKDWMRTDAAKALVHVCALIKSKASRLGVLVREEGGDTAHLDMLLTFYALKMLNMFKREVQSV